jgi:NADPH:quinone reductase-like Zn-dependent oxidoreductase
MIRQFGAITVEEVPTPEPRGDEVLVEVHAAAINPSDVKNVSGAMHGTTLPRIPGRDFAGVVRRGPADLVGKEVWGTGGDIGFTRDGTHAEYVLLPRAGIALRPAVVSIDAAGSAGVTFVTAWQAMVTAANISPGETALIIGAAGGVGSAAVQITKLHGARVIGAVRSETDFTAARQNGADEVITSTSRDFVVEARKLTGGHGANVVFDTSGMLFAEAVEAAAMEGRIPVITSPKDGMATFNLRSLYRKMMLVIGVDSRDLGTVKCAKMLETMSPAFQSGQLRATVGVTRPLSDAVAAYADAARGGPRIIFHPFDF